MEEDIRELKGDLQGLQKQKDPKDFEEKLALFENKLQEKMVVHDKLVSDFNK